MGMLIPLDLGTTLSSSFVLRLKVCAAREKLLQRRLAGMEATGNTVT